MSFFSHRLDGVRVLVVDDREDDRELYTFVLTQCGAQVTAVGTAAEALSTFDQASPDVLLSDVSLRDGDGYGLIRSLRARGCTVHAVAVTGHVREQDRTEALAAGFDLHLPKPVSLTALCESVANLSA
jgi:CheY-like chemotaxis protein